MGVMGRDRLGINDEYEALWRLKLYKECPHTETAFAVMSLLLWEDPAGYSPPGWVSWLSTRET
jgi:hypothetical protein